MLKRTWMVMGTALTWLVIASLLVSGCGGGGKPAAKATQAPEVEPTEASAPASEGGSESSTESKALDNLIKLAPVHIVSSYTYKKGSAEENQAGIEADMDAKGNQHLFLKDKDGKATELYLVDGKLYLKAEGGEGEGQFMVIPDVPQDSAFSFLAIYGGAYLLAYNDLQDAKKVGSESVNNFQTNKYEIKYNMGSLGLGGLAAGAATGANFDYKGYAWLEATTGALIRSQVDWTAKGANEDETETFHAQFEATKGTVTEVKAPENVFDLNAALTPQAEATETPAE